MNVLNKVDEILADGYQFDLGGYLNEGWSIFKREAGSFIGFLFLSFLIGIVSAIIPLLGVFIYSIALSPALIAGYYLVSHRIRKKETFEFSNFFDGFSFLGRLAGQTLIQSAIYIAVFVPSIAVLGGSGILEWYLDTINDPLSGMRYLPNLGLSAILVIFLNLLPFLYLRVSYMFASLFIVFYGMEPWGALETSRKIITKRWFSVFTLPLALYGLVILAFLPVLLCLVFAPMVSVFLMVGLSLALVFLYPSVHAIIYSAFADIMDLGQEIDSDDGTDLLDHLIDMESK